jgi:PAS domain S-box-containing protein
LELNLLGLETRLEQAEERRLAEASSAAAHLAEREAEFASSLEHMTHSRELLALQLSVSTAALEDSRQDRAAETATAAERYRALEERLAREVTAREAVETQVSAAAAALDESRQILASETTAAAARLAEREAELGATLADSVAARSELERQLSENERRLAQNEQQLVDNARLLDTSEQRLADKTQQLADTQQRLENNARQLASSVQELADTGRKLTEIELLLAVREQELEDNALTLAESERQAAAHVEQLAQSTRALAENQAALHQTEQRATADLAAAAQRYSELEERLAQEVRRRTRIEQTLAEAEVARTQADERRASELATAAAHLAEVQAQSDARLAEAAAAHDQLAQKLSETEASLEGSRRERAAEATAAADRLASREAELGTQLAETISARAALEHALAQANAAHQRTQERAGVELAAAADRQASTEARLAQELDTRVAVEHDLANARSAQREAEERHAAAMAEAAATRDGLEQRLRATLTTLEESRQQLVAEAAAAGEQLARRQAEHEALIAEAGAARTALERALADAEARHRQTQLRAASDLSAAASRHEAVEADLRREATYRQAVERDLMEARRESLQTRRRLLTRALGIRRRASERRTALEAQRQQERAEYLQTIAERSDVIREIQLDSQALRQALSTAQDQLHRLNETIEQERLAHEQDRQTRDADLRRVSAESEQVRHTLDQVSAAFQALEVVSSQHATERARLDIVVTEREAQLAAQASSHGAAQEVAANALRQSEEKLRATQEASRHDIALLHGELNAVRQALEATTSERDLLQIDADRVPLLQSELDQSQNDHRRQFERAPLGMWRCSRDGAITHANRSLVGLLGYRTADELRKVDFATTIFESADDLRWLIERSVDTGTTELLETTWRRKDRGRLVVRLQAVTVGTDSIEIIAEDITELRAVEDKLRQAQRMEAVGRLASEVAVTCDNLLRDVTQDGQQWLAAIDSDPVLRHQGEQLLGEVTRAASFLRQLGVYGERQVNALEPVSMNRVLRDMEAVLKRVAGDDIELILPKGAPALDVDVETERVERVLVNVASYARERMPAGGRLKIDLAPVVADRRFIAKYPNVRPGDHVLITVTEVPGAVRSDRAGSLQPEQTEARTTPSDKPGVDLGALLALIGDCGGHLWMSAEPPGNMVLKIHLPRRGSDQGPEAHQAGARPQRGAMSRWFRH